MNKQLLKIAGQQAIRGNFGSSITALKDAFSSEVISGTYQRGNLKASKEVWELVRAMSGNNFTYTGPQSCVKAYQLCPPVASIINKKAIADALGKYTLTRVGSKANGKEAMTPEAIKLRALLQSPNPLQSGMEFWLQVKIYSQLFGHCIILPSGGPLGFSALEAKYWWILPPTMYDFEEFDSVDFTTGQTYRAVRVSNGSKSFRLPVGEFLLIKDVSPSFNMFGIPTSRVQGVELPISNVIGAYESRGVLINQRGPTIVVSSDKKDADGTIPLTPTEKEQMQSEFAARYGLSRGQVSALFTNASIKVEAVGFNTKDLMLLEETKESTVDICHAFTYPPELMQQGDKGSTFSNGYNADKVLYQNAIIPESDMLISQLSSWLKLASLGIELSKDFSHVAALAENKKEEADARKILTESVDMAYKSDAITLNRYRELIGEEPADGGDVYYSQVASNTNEQQGQQGQSQANASGN